MLQIVDGRGGQTGDLAEGKAPLIMYASVSPHRRLASPMVVRRIWTLDIDSKLLNWGASWFAQW
jgi:hypothetical protein